MELEVAKIADFYRGHKRMPSFSELEGILGYRSKGAVSYFIQKLIDKGYVGKDKTGRLIPKNLGEVKVLGLIEAGFPTSASEELIDTMSLDEFLIDKKEATYMLKVKGESMIGAGIMPGDMVLVERGAEPRVGDIVIAEVDGEYTMKYFRKKGNKHYLEASNSRYKDIYPVEELKIPAVVRAVIRKY
ncbi:LexA family transcriptional regulator [Candidatus Parcubacteria bacterium]|nr:LexA family transcriptional regulator [Candidatus Parcubacteria bacterium]